MPSYAVPERPMARRLGFRHGAMTALALLMTISPFMGDLARAQEGAPAYDDGGDQYAGDPPARVGRLARVQGTVSFHTADGTQWDPATPNYPLTSGNALWTEPGASATVDVSTTRLIMDGTTELDIDSLDDRDFTADLAQGQVYVRIRGLLPGERYSLRTPRGLVTLEGPGRYEVSAGDTDTPTRVTVLEGAAQLSGQGLSLRINGGQTGEITGDNPPNVNVRPAEHDPFLTAMLRTDRVGSSTPPPDVMAMPGADDLGEYGSWQATPDYGQVWYPQVEPDWAPYRDGHWAYVAPWGWTWIDDAPWGFAPFHYGRWVDIRGRWAWAPGGAVVVGGPPPPPVYAPALVAFFGAGVAIGVGIGGPHFDDRGHPPVGWCPLGWQEPYHPWYRASPRYVEYVNRPVVRNLTVVNNVTNITINNYANRRGASMMPADAMAAGRYGRYNGGARPWDERQLADARAVVGRPPLQPTAATAGVTPQVAQRLRLPDAGGGPARHPPSPGPRFEPRPEGATLRHLDLRGPDGIPGGGPQAGATRPDDPHPSGNGPQPDHPGGFRPTDRRPDEPGFHPGQPGLSRPEEGAAAWANRGPGGLPALRDHNRPPGPPPVRQTAQERPGPAPDQASSQGQQPGHPPQQPRQPDGRPGDAPRPQAQPGPGQQAGPERSQPGFPVPHGERRRPDLPNFEERRQPPGPQPQHGPPQPQARPSAAEAPRQPDRPQPQHEFRPPPRPENPQTRPQSPPEPRPHMEMAPRPEMQHMPPPQARPEAARPQAPQHPQPQGHPEPHPQPPGRSNDTSQPHRN
ncbi:DUF6600 domain-containing protein [Nitrospirillum sp. BR 11163]|uniref:DUF6600 domain-containing protein n=1 Tax=Nitrospirillum sp. BR 11163 TaxID=3104323 RepID=UPI002AFDC978|nr:DUF6600 domain-containing protein [Nitrospirillum sp. BR 11163]MEA1674043.1 DUF6600 domain-containing protein [Nitrospirillum sp. BR 11163]